MNDSIKQCLSHISQVFKDDFSLLKHSLDVYCLTKSLYLALPCSKKAELNKTKLLMAALFHDIGKISIAKGLLHKNDKLTDGEMELIKHHVVYGRKILIKMGFENVSDFVFYHHEREDGKGYLGLTKDETPFESKIIAVADTFSALTLTRSYRKGMSVKKALNIIEDVSGTQLDTNTVHIFCDMIRKQRAFNRRLELYMLLIPLVLKARLGLIANQVSVKLIKA